MDEGYVSKRNSLTQSREWIRQRLDTLSNDLSEIERDMNFYKQTNRTLNTNVETELFVRNAMYVEDELFENDANIRHVENLLTFFSENAHEWDEIPNNIKHNYISHQISRYNEALIQLKNTKNFVNSRNPVVQAEIQNVMSMRNSIENSITSYYESMLIKQNELLSRKITAENKIGGISSNIKNDVEMRRYRRVKRAVYRYLTKKYETTMIQLERIAPDARIIEPPTGSENYIWPRKKRLTAAALMIGFLLPCIPIVIQVIFSRKVRDKKDVVDIVSAPILGEIISKSKAQQGMELIVKEDSNDPVSESFRMIRSSLKFFNQGEFKVLSTSSTIPGEGKSYFAINIAMTLALSGKRVCMIDLDLRRRKMTVDMNMLKKQGVTEYLISKTDNINKLLYKTDVLDNLYIIPSGTIPPNPAELLAGNRFDVLMNELKEQFDYIITDNPPANIVADGKISNRHTDITCYVIRVGHLNREELPFVEEIYKEGQFRNFAVVLSDVPNMNKYEYKQQY